MQKNLLERVQEEIIKPHQVILKKALFLQNLILHQNFHPQLQAILKRENLLNKEQLKNSKEMEIKKEKIN